MSNNKRSREEDLNESNQDFLNRISKEKEETACVSIIKHMDRLHSAGRFIDSNWILENINFSKISSQRRRTFLMITKPAKEFLPCRQEKYNEALNLSENKQSLKNLE